LRSGSKSKGDERVARLTRKRHARGACEFCSSISGGGSTKLGDLLVEAKKPEFSDLASGELYARSEVTTFLIYDLRTSSATAFLNGGNERAAVLLADGGVAALITARSRLRSERKFADR